jgi:hypothetical protein
MTTFINRDFSRPEEDDFKLNVQPHLDRDATKEAVPKWKLPPGCFISGREEVIGWTIQPRYE